MLQSITGYIRAKGWMLYERPHMMNVVGIRSRHTRAGYFDDTLHVFYRDEKGKWVHRFWRATLDPGLPYLHVPVVSAGTAIIQAGQYVDCYELDHHRGNPEHPALCQRLGPVSIVRDNNRDSILDFRASEPVSGMFGINIHRTSYSALVPGRKEIRKDSAGCTVLEDPDEYNDELLPLLRLHERLHGNVFSYTVIDLRSVRRHSLAQWALRLSLALAASLLGAALFPKTQSDDDDK